MRQGDQWKPGSFQPRLAAAGFIHHAELNNHTERSMMTCYFRILRSERAKRRLQFGIVLPFSRVHWLPGVISAVLLFATMARGADPLQALIIDGQNNHGDWPKTTMMMRQYLRDSQRFTVDIARTRYTWQGDDRLREYPLDDGREYTSLPEPRTDPDFAPQFADYDVVISNFGFNAAPWPAATRDAFEHYVRKRRRVRRHPRRG